MHKIFISSHKEIRYDYFITNAFSQVLDLILFPKKEEEEVLDFMLQVMTCGKIRK